MQASDAYSLHAFWHQRRESAEECAERAIRLFRSLGELNGAFSNWYGLGRSRQEALQRRLPLEEQPIAELLRRQHKRSRRAGGTEDSGFPIVLWNGDEDVASVGVQLRCGSYARSLRNHFGMNFPRAEDRLEPLLEPDLLTGIFRCVVSTLDPEWAVLTVYRRLIGPEPLGWEPEIHWWTFLSARLVSVPALPPPARTVPLGPSGSLIVATDERFDSQNPRHVAAVANVRDSLKRAGFGLSGP